MTGIKMARIIKCHGCPFFRNGIPPAFDSPGCRAGGHYTADGPPIDVPGYGIVPSHLAGDPVLVLGDLYYEGPEENCPMGYWVGLVPVDIDGEAKKQEEALMARWEEEPMFLMLTEEQAIKAMEAYVERGDLTVELAEKILKGKEAKDVDT